jgi:hypothetical protein
MQITPKGLSVTKLFAPSFSHRHHCAFPNWQYG